MMLQNSFLLLATLCVCVSSTHIEDKVEGVTLELMSQFKLWTQVHEKHYDTHQEKMQRLETWLENDSK